MLQRSLERQAQGIAAIEMGRLGHHGANEIVGQEVDGQFLADHFRGFGA